MSGHRVQHSFSFGGGATISACARYRYYLERRILEAETKGVLAARGCLGWLMLNPSIADAVNDDPTSRKVYGFTGRAGYQRLVVVNLFAYRATQPKVLQGMLREVREGGRSIADVVGPHNDQAILRALDECDAFVCAWGAQPWARERALDVLALIERHNRPRAIPLLCLGQAKDGSPLHPLMPSYDGHPLVPFTTELPIADAGVAEGSTSDRHEDRAEGGAARGRSSAAALDAGTHPGGCGVVDRSDRPAREPSHFTKETSR